MAERPGMPLRHLTADDLRPAWSRLDIPTKRIAEALGVTRSGLSYKARSLGLPPRTGNKLPCTKLSEAEFKRLWMSGATCKEIMEAGGYADQGAVSTRRRNLGLPPRKRVKGTKKPSGWVPQKTAEDLLADLWADLRARERVK